MSIVDISKDVIVNFKGATGPVGAAGASLSYPVIGSGGSSNSVTLVPSTTPITSQGQNSVAIGANAGTTSQGTTLLPFSVYEGGGTKYVGTGGIDAPAQGMSVCISKDGTTIAVAGPNDNSNTGAVWIYTYVNGVVTQQQKITGPTTFQSFFGRGSDSSNGGSENNISLSDDGNTLAVGINNDLSGVNQTCAWIYTRSGGVWTGYSSNPLIANVGFKNSTGQLGNVALSGDGLTLAIGNQQNTIGYTRDGSVVIFVKSGTTWSQQGGTLLPTTRATGDYFGHSVSLSYDGNVLAAGGSQAGSGSGGFLCIFTRSGTTWTHVVQLMGSTKWPGQNTWFGASVSISGNGLIVAVGAPVKGAVTVIEKNTSGVYTLSSTPSLEVSVSYFGKSISLSTDGKTLLVGSLETVGKLYTYKYVTTGQYDLQQTILPGNNISSSPKVGCAVSMSGDTNIIVAGGSGETSNTGFTTGALWLWTSTSLTGSALAIGDSSGQTKQGSASVAIGYQAGQNNQGNLATAIGYQAGQNNQPANSLFLSTIGMRYLNTTLNYVQYNPITGEISYCATGHSDSRLKENIQDADEKEMIGMLKQIQLKNFEFIDKNQSQNTFGILADDLEKIQGLGEQTITTNPSFIPSIYSPTTLQVLDENMNVLQSTEKMVPTIPSLGPMMPGTTEEKEMKETTHYKGTYLKIFLDNKDGDDGKKKLKKDDNVRFFTYLDNVIPTQVVQKTTVDETKGFINYEKGHIDHQTIVMEATDLYIIVNNNNNLTTATSNVFVYGPFVTDMKVISDSDNILWLLVAAEKQLRNNVESMRTRINSIKQVLQDRKIQ